MTIDRANVAAEAARRAEEARQRAEAARQRAEAARKAAEAQKAQLQAAKQAAQEAPKAQADRAEGLLQEARQAYKEADKTADGLTAKADTRERKADRAETRAETAERAEAALGTLDELKTGMAGTPEQKAATAARILTDPAVQESLQGLGGLKGTPAYEAAYKELKAVSAEATPAKLAEALAANPDLTAYPPEFAGQVAQLREGLTQSVGQLQGQEAKAAQSTLDALGGALDQSASALLDREGGVTLAQLKDNPGLGQVLAGAQDPAVKARVAEAAKGWAKESLLHHLEGKEGEDGVEEAVNAFQDEMKGLIESTALSQERNLIGAIQDGAGGLEDDQAVTDKLKSVSEDNGGGIGGWLQDRADDAVNLLGKGSELLGKAIDGFSDLTGGALDGAFDLAGKLNPANLALKGLSGTLDAVGLDGAADVVGKGSDLIEKGFDLAGDAAQKFHAIQTDVLQGFRAGAVGLVSGTVSSIAHPVDTFNGMKSMVQDPGGAAKALWAEATKEGGIAGAIGYFGANALPAILSGGSSLAGTGGSLALRAALRMPQAGKLGSLSTSLGTTAFRLERLATKLDGAYNNVAGVRSLLNSGSRQKFIPDNHRLAKVDAGGAGLRDELAGLREAPSLARTPAGRRELLQRAENLFVEGYVNIGEKALKPLGIPDLPASAKELIALTANARLVNDTARQEEIRREALDIPTP